MVGYVLACAGTGVAALGLGALLSIFFVGNPSSPEPRDFYLAVSFGGMVFGIAGWTELRFIRLQEKVDELLGRSPQPTPTVNAAVWPASVARNATFEVSGIVTVASGSVAGTAVSVRVVDPGGVDVGKTEATVAGSGPSGTYAAKMRAGGGGGWAQGKYRVFVAYGPGGSGAPATAEAALEYFASAKSPSPVEQPASTAPQRGAEAALSHRGDALSGMVSEKLASTLEEWSAKQSVDELYLVLGCQLATIEVSVNQHLLDYLKTNLSRMGLPEGADEVYRRKGYDFLRAHWEGVRGRACVWYGTNPGLTGRPLIAGLTASLAAAVPKPWSDYPSVCAVTAVILARAGLGAICSSKAPLPAPTPK